MIQRIQSIYLFIALLIIESLFFLPLGEIVADTQNFKLFYNGFFEITQEGVSLISDTFSIFILIPLVGFFNLLAIILFKNRKLQMRIVMYNLLLMIGLSGIIAFLLYYKFAGLNASVLPNISIVFPAIAAILNFLAYRKIRIDEALVKSMDRIR